jgi:hypothetical protein
MRRAFSSSLALLAVCQSLAACRSGVQSLEWRFVAISSDEDRIARIDVIEARIMDGGCGGEAIFATDLVVGEGAAAALAPPVLGSGTYGVAGRAYGADCIYLFAGCVEATLPRSGVLEVRLEEIAAEPACEPGDPGAAEIEFTIGSRDRPRAISPWIYGANAPDVGQARRLATLYGAATNRWSTHNWENGASNAGAWFGWGNDLLLAAGTEGPAPAIATTLGRARDGGMAAILTVPLMARVAADGDGTEVDPIADYDSRFVESRAARGGPLDPTPDLEDGVVYQDELVRYVEHGPLARCESCARDVVWSLDTEPDNWPDSYDGLPEAESFPASELLDRSMEMARAIRAVDPGAIIIGPWVTLSSLPEFRPAVFPSDGQLDFVRAYSDRVFEELPTSVLPLVDAFATTYKSEADDAIGEHDTVDARVVQLRMHAARSLWDESYIEDSWVTREFFSNEPLVLIPRIREILEDQPTGMRVALPRWNFGGGSHVSGAIAAAEALGAFAREDVLLACIDDMGGRPYLEGAFAMYRDYDGLGGTFGDLWISSETSDRERTSVWASTFDGAPERAVIVATNRSSEAIEVALRITHRRRFTSAQVYELTAGAPTPLRREILIALPERNALRVVLSPTSVTTIALE